jgi:drug/metabolite transporter (DMT)-like permease
MLLGSLAFAGMAASAHALRSHSDWQVIALARAALQLLFALALAMAAGVPLLVWRPGMLWIRSIAGSIAMVCQFFAYTRLPVSDVLTLANMFPIWVALLAWPVLHQPPSGPVWLAVASGVVGVALIQQPHFAEGNFAALVALASSVLTAIAMIALHQLGGIDARAIIVHFSAVALLFCVGSLFLFERTRPFQLVWQGWPIVLLLGVGVTALVGQLFLTKAYASGDAAKVSVVGLTQIVFALVFDVLLFDYRFSVWTLVGIVMVVAPTAWLMVVRAKGR